MDKKLPALIGLALILGLAAYLDSPDSIMNRNYAYTVSEPVSAQPIDESSSTNTPVIKERLEKKEKVDGYIVEIYREYEVYKDKNGNIIKSVPTSKTDMLKYWDYKHDMRAAQ
ncbi:MAG: hypothetical protein Q8934_14725 [Bacillota bacterium]|nr:hypothetical protein [Bacillota bacterium]